MAVQTKFTAIIHLFTSYHCGVQVSDTENIPCFGQLFLERVIISQVVVIGVMGGVVGGLNIGL